MNNIKKLLRVSAGIALFFGAVNIFSYGVLSLMDSFAPNPKSYRCEIAMLPYCNKPSSKYGDGLRMNRQGYIDERAFSNIKAENTYRVAIFGGSTSLPFCQTKKRDDAALQLENLLNEHYKKLNFEVWNASVVGYSVREQSIAIRDYFGPKGNLDLAIIQEPINHIYLCYDAVVDWKILDEFEKNNFRRFFTYTPLSELLFRINDFTRSWTGHMKEKQENSYSREFGHGNRSEYYGLIKNGRLNVVWNSLERIMDSSEQCGFDVMFGIMPMMFTKDAVDWLGVPFFPACINLSESYKMYYDFNEATKKTYMDFSTKYRIPLVRHDLTFEIIPIENLKEDFCDFVHPNERGHGVIAKNLLESIKKIVPDKSYYLLRRQNGIAGN